MPMCAREEWDCPVNELKKKLAQLEKEADWLAFQLAQEPTVYLRCFGCETNLFGDTCVKCWRQEAQKAVSDEQIRSDG